MNSNYPFQLVEVRNRLGSEIQLQVYPFSLDNGYLCLLISLPENTHPAILAKNIEHIAIQLGEYFHYSEKHFSIIEVRREEQGEVWYSWQFNWIGNTPLEPQSSEISSNQRQYYQKAIAGYGKASNA